MNTKYDFRSFLLLIGIAISVTLKGQVTHITNASYTLTDGLLNVLDVDTAQTGVINILALQRGTTGTAQNGIGGAILFRNQINNGGYSLAGKISSSLTGVTPGSVVANMKFDVFTNGSVSNYMFLNAAGVGLNTLNPQAQLDIHSTSNNPAHFRGTSPMWMGLYENSEYRGYIGSYSGAVTDVDFGTGGGNTTGKVHLVIQAVPKLTLDAAGKVGIGTVTPASYLYVNGPSGASTNLINSVVNYTGTVDVIAVEGQSTPADGYGIAGYFVGGYRGVYASGSAGTYTGTAYGVYALASGSTGTRTALFASATGGTTNWAGYFSSGNVFVQNDLRVGTTGGAAGYKVSVDGKVIAEEVRVQNSTAWPDYVFTEGYQMPSLLVLEQSILEHGHLPGIPSAEVIDTEGFDLGDMQVRTMEKVEELTLYLIQMQKQVDQLKSENHALHNEINLLRQ